jgi:hypothetical protein
MPGRLLERLLAVVPALLLSLLLVARLLVVPGLIVRAP